MEKEFQRRLEVYNGDIILLIERLIHSIKLYTFCYNKLGGRYILRAENSRKMLILANSYFDNLNSLEA